MTQLITGELMKLTPRLHQVYIQVKYGHLQPNLKVMLLTRKQLLM